MTGKVDYKKLVKEAARGEFLGFKTILLESGDTERVFDSALEINTKKEILEVLYGELLGTMEYRALSHEGANVLRNLYNELSDGNYVPANNEYVLAEVIKAYCKDKYAELYSEESKTQYFGNDENGIAYYYMPEGLSVERLHDIREPSEYYVIAAPVCYLSPELKAQHRITFLKTDRDIAECELDDDRAISNMERAVKGLVEREWDMTNLPNNVACRLSIEEGIKANYDGWSLGKGFEDDIIREHGMERVLYVLANTIREKMWDGRFSLENKKWAKEYQIPEDELNKCFVVETHPAVLDGFINRICKMHSRQENVYYTRVIDRGDYGDIGYRAIVLNEVDGKIYNLFDEPYSSMDTIMEDIKIFQSEYPEGRFIEKNPTQFFTMSEIVNREATQRMAKKEERKKLFAKKWKQDNGAKKAETVLE